jgi:hypothetical protein
MSAANDSSEESTSVECTPAAVVQEEASDVVASPPPQQQQKKTKTKTKKKSAKGRTHKPSAMRLHEMRELDLETAFSIVDKGSMRWVKAYGWDGLRAKINATPEGRSMVRAFHNATKVEQMHMLKAHPLMYAAAGFKVVYGVWLIDLARAMKPKNPKRAKQWLKTLHEVVDNCVADEAKGGSAAPLARMKMTQDDVLPMASGKMSYGSEGATRRQDMRFVPIFVLPFVAMKLTRVAQREIIRGKLVSMAVNFTVEMDSYKSDVNYGAMQLARQTSLNVDLTSATIEDAVARAPLVADGLRETRRSMKTLRDGTNRKHTALKRKLDDAEGDIEVLSGRSEAQSRRIADLEAAQSRRIADLEAQVQKLSAAVAAGGSEAGASPSPRKRARKTNA